MKNTQMYRAFGLNIQCELPTAISFGLTCSSAAIPDVCISLGDVPCELEGAEYKDPFISAIPGCILLRIKGIARFLIRNGKEIIIKSEPDAKAGNVATFAFGSALGTILYQRGILALHGSAVRTPKGAVIFSGEKGAGKSTTAAALSVKGWEFISDDVCAIHMENDIPVLYPGLSRAKLSEESYSRVLGHTPTESPISPILKKYGAPFQASREPSRLYAVCSLETASTEPSIERIMGAQRLSSLAGHVYRPLIYNLTVPSNRQFRQYASITDNTLALRVSRPSDFSKMNEFLTLLEDKILA